MSPADVGPGSLRPATGARPGPRSAQPPPLRPRGIAREVNTPEVSRGFDRHLPPGVGLRTGAGRRHEHGSRGSNGPGAGREGHPTGAERAEGAPAGGGVELTCNPAGSREVGRPGSAGRRARRASLRPARPRRSYARRARHASMRGLARRVPASGRDSPGLPGSTRFWPPDPVSSSPGTIATARRRRNDHRRS